MSAIERLKKQSDRQKVNLWLDSIGETDPECRREVLDHCAKDPDARAYYVSRYEEISHA